MIDNIYPKRAYSKGYQDRLDHLFVNPYIMIDSLAKAWAYGWLHADMESLDGWSPVFSLESEDRQG